MTKFALTALFFPFLCFALRRPCCSVVKALALRSALNSVQSFAFNSAVTLRNRMLKKHAIASFNSFISWLISFSPIYRFTPKLFNIIKSYSTRASKVALPYKFIMLNSRASFACWQGRRRAKHRKGFGLLSFLHHSLTRLLYF